MPPYLLERPGTAYLRSLRLKTDGEEIILDVIGRLVGSYRALPGPVLFGRKEGGDIEDQARSTFSKPILAYKLLCAYHLRRDCPARWMDAVQPQHQEKKYSVSQAHRQVICNGCAIQFANGFPYRFLRDGRPSGSFGLYEFELYMVLYNFNSIYQHQEWAGGTS